VTIERSVIGPNVTLESGTRVVNSRLEHVLVGGKSTVVDCHLHHSLLGDRVSVRGLRGVATLGNDSEVSAT
jgi:glucose-1-phosphate thymidylyltransferase